MFFLWFWGRPGCSMGWAHMQSAHACAVETHFFVFACFLKNRLQMISFWIHFGSVFCHKITILKEKRAPRSCSKKGDPPWLKQRTMTLARRSLAAPLACAVFWTRNNCLSKKQQQLLISESMSELCSGMGSVWARNNNSCSFLSQFLSSVLEWVLSESISEKKSCFDEAET